MSRFIGKRQKDEIGIIYKIKNLKSLVSIHRNITILKRYILCTVTGDFGIV